MKTYVVYYSYVIYNNKKEAVSNSKKGTIEVEASDVSSVNTGRIRDEIRRLANKACKKDEEILHANYYKIEELM